MMQLCNFFLQLVQLTCSYTLQLTCSYTLLQIHRLFRKRQISWRLLKIIILYSILCDYKFKCWFISFSQGPVCSTPSADEECVRVVRVRPVSSDSSDPVGPNSHHASTGKHALPQILNTLNLQAFVYVVLHLALSVY